MTRPFATQLDHAPDQAASAPARIPGRMPQRATGPTPRATRMRALRGWSGLALLALLSACASHPPQMTATQEAAVYKQRARDNYAPPGPPDDPWGPYIAEASQRYDVPERWIREVMRVESGAQMYHDGVLTTSPVGAMGLMQLMPETYDELRARYGLSDDAYDPHNNILAGAAYIREMYDVYGSPGFLAAYNGGPARLDDYLTRNRPLPDETRRYVAMIGPYIQGIFPSQRSPADMMAMNQIPVNIPAGPRFVRRAYAVARTRHGAARVEYAQASRAGTHRHAQAVEVAELTRPTRPAAPPARVQTVAYLSPQQRRDFHLIDRAEAAEAPLPRGHADATGGWAIQVGAFGNQSQASAAAARARSVVATAHMAVAGVSSGHAKLYRARLTGLSRTAAIQACERLSHGRGNCMVVSPDSQS
ncbi:MAG TPA: lytic transglycosylase domain-containing protein [Acetobacteraceae bacterium]|nr:lytic transglycosylase domain-containing protein [Acetobacteraceae bacterium]